MLQVYLMLSSAIFLYISYLTGKSKGWVGLSDFFQVLAGKLDGAFFSLSFSIGEKLSENSVEGKEFTLILCL